jgi:hypothetical protein
MRAHHALAAAALLLASAPAFARIKLTALPERERVEIRLDHGRFTLVEEERIVPLLESTPETGNNRIDFSWSNTAIDKDSIRFRPIAVREGDRLRPLQDGEVKVLSVAYPPGENALVWEVYAKKACAVQVRVSYLISNLTRSFAYVALADKAESRLVLRKFLQLRNYSGEAYGAAGLWAGFGPRFTKPLDGQTDLKVLLERFAAVPIEKTYTFDWYANGPLHPDKPFASRVLMHYVLRNDERNGLGKYPLQPGKVRIFIEDGRGGEAFLGEDLADLTPLDGAMRLFLGEARDVVCTRTVALNRRQPVRGKLFHQEVQLRYEVENYKDKAVRLDLVESLNRLAQEYGAPVPGDVEWEQGPATSPELKLSFERGGATPVLHVDLPPRPGDGRAVEKRTVVLHVILKNLWQ